MNLISRVKDAKFLDQFGFGNYSTLDQIRLETFIRYAFNRKEQRDAFSRKENAVVVFFFLMKESL